MDAQVAEAAAKVKVEVDRALLHGWVAATVEQEGKLASRCVRVCEREAVVVGSGSGAPEFLQGLRPGDTVGFSERPLRALRHHAGMAGEMGYQANSIRHE